MGWNYRMMLRFKAMTDAELAVEESHLRERAHSAPRSDGNGSLAWALWSREWGACRDEMGRRRNA